VNLNATTAQDESTGYTHALYCQSLGEIGKPRCLGESGGWILERRIPDSDQLDAMGCYPLFACRNWSRLHRDLNQLQNELLTLAIVADPFGEYDLAYLNQCFPDLVLPFKHHMVIDLSRSPEAFVAAHHRRNARNALDHLAVERCDEPRLFGDDWTQLYANLIARHDIRGLAAFSPATLKAQLAVPGLNMFRAAHQGKTVGITLWYVDGHVAYYHLGAYSEIGYELGASFGLFWQVIEYFSNQGLRWINLGGGAGISDTFQDDGLSRFKRGWATGTRTAYFCGRIFDRQAYDRITKNKQTASGYFPAYREGEFS
jgi:hypothetical protein